MKNMNELKKERTTARAAYTRALKTNDAARIAAALARKEAAESAFDAAKEAEEARAEATTAEADSMEEATTATTAAPASDEVADSNEADEATATPTADNAADSEADSRADSIANEAARIASATRAEVEAVKLAALADIRAEYATDKKKAEAAKKTAEAADLRKLADEATAEAAEAKKAADEADEKNADNAADLRKEYRAAFKEATKARAAADEAEADAEAMEAAAALLSEKFDEAAEGNDVVISFRMKTAADVIAEDARAEYAAKRNAEDAAAILPILAKDAARADIRKDFRLFAIAAFMKPAPAAKLADLAAKMKERNAAAKEAAKDAPRVCFTIGAVYDSRRPSSFLAFAHEVAARVADSMNAAEYIAEKSAVYNLTKSASLLDAAAKVAAKVTAKNAIMRQGTPTQWKIYADAAAGNWEAADLADLYQTAAAALSIVYAPTEKADEVRKAADRLEAGARLLSKLADADSEARAEVMRKLSETMEADAADSEARADIRAAFMEAAAKLAEKEKNESEARAALENVKREARAALADEVKPAAEAFEEKEKARKEAAEGITTARREEVAARVAANKERAEAAADLAEKEKEAAALHEEATEKERAAKEAAALLNAESIAADLSKLPTAADLRKATADAEAAAEATRKEYRKADAAARVVENMRKYNAARAFELFDEVESRRADLAAKLADRIAEVEKAKEAEATRAALEKKEAEARAEVEAAKNEKPAAFSFDIYRAEKRERKSREAFRAADSNAKLAAVEEVRKEEEKGKPAPRIVEAMRKYRKAAKESGEAFDVLKKAREGAAAKIEAAPATMEARAEVKKARAELKAARAEYAEARAAFMKYEAADLSPLAIDNADRLKARAEELKILAAAAAMKEAADSIEENAAFVSEGMRGGYRSINNYLTDARAIREEANAAPLSWEELTEKAIPIFTASEYEKRRRVIIRKAYREAAPALTKAQRRVLNAVYKCGGNMEAAARKLHRNKKTVYEHMAKIAEVFAAAFAAVAPNTYEAKAADLAALAAKKTAEAARADLAAKRKSAKKANDNAARRNEADAAAKLADAADLAAKAEAARVIVEAFDSLPPAMKEAARRIGHGESKRAIAAALRKDRKTIRVSIATAARKIAAAIQKRAEEAATPAKLADLAAAAAKLADAADLAALLKLAE